MGRMTTTVNTHRTAPQAPQALVERKLRALVAEFPGVSIKVGAGRHRATLTGHFASQTAAAATALVRAGYTVRLGSAAGVLIVGVQPR